MTNNLKRRLKEHRSGSSRYTNQFLPIYLKSCIIVGSRNHAESLEKYFKSGSGIAFMKKRILRSADE